METTKLTLEQQNGYLAHELNKLRTEASHLRQRLHENGKHPRRVQKAYEDALLLASWASLGIFPSRRFSRRYEISQNRWQNALALLRLARVVQDNRRWVVRDLATIERRLDTARQRALDDRQHFFLYLNQHGKS